MRLLERNGNIKSVAEFCCMAEKYRIHNWKQILDLEYYLYSSLVTNSDWLLDQRVIDLYYQNPAFVH